ncbi:hypothetical protein NKJ81_27580 [Mesorhizobium sp. M0018]|uniref:trypsin-like serine peptidase n=1 Tax=Mesorhizobium sp. M0018 TaxID=2956844 RepID=UPI0033368074
MTTRSTFLLSLLAVFAVVGPARSQSIFDVLKQRIKLPASALSRPEDPIVVDICKKDPLACLDRFPSAPSNLCELDPDTCVDSHLPNLPIRELQPSPLCEIDPCACENCKLNNAGGIGAFEDAVAPVGFEASGTGLVGPEVLAAPRPFASFASPLASGGPQLKTDEKSSFGFDLETARGQLTATYPEKLICNNSTSRPVEYWRELLLRRSESERCSEAAQIMLEQRGKHRLTYFDILSGKTRRENAKTEFKVFEDYGNACIHRVEDIDSNAAAKFSFGENFKEKVKENVGELNFDGKDVHCTATIVQFKNGNEDKIGLATAAHCVGDPIKGTSDQNLQFASVHSQMHFTTFSGKSYPVEIDPGLRGFVYGKTYDAVIIPLISVAAGDQLPTGFKISGRPTLWQPLYIVAVNPFLAALRNLTLSSDNDGLASASVSLEPGCRVYGIKGAQIYHNCQSEGGMSGSPIFVTAENEAKIVAVHSGEVATPLIPECPQPTAGAANYGTLLSQK